MSGTRYQALPCSIMLHLTVLSYTFCSPNNLLKRNYFAFSVSSIKYFSGCFRPSRGEEKLGMGTQFTHILPFCKTFLSVSLYQIRNILFLQSRNNLVCLNVRRHQNNPFSFRDYVFHKFYVNRGLF